MKWHESSRTNPFLSLDSNILLIPVSTLTDWKERSNKQDANKHSYSIESLKMDLNRRSDPSSSGIADDSFAAKIDRVMGVTSLHLHSVLGRDSNKELSSIQAKGTSKGCEQSVVD